MSMCGIGAILRTLCAVKNCAVEANLLAVSALSNKAWTCGVGGSEPSLATDSSLMLRAKPPRTIGARERRFNSCRREYLLGTRGHFPAFRGMVPEEGAGHVRSWILGKFAPRRVGGDSHCAA